MPENPPQSAAANPDLAALHTQLIGLADKLNQAFSRSKSKTEGIAILDEIGEVNARVASVGRQLFTQRTAAITKGVEKVSAALPEAEEAIAHAEDLKKLVGGLTRFLKLVDAVVDVAKLVV